jgi:hypothetical protein
MFASVGNNRIRNILLHVTYTGPWVADVDFDDSADVSGSVVIQFGTLELHGTVLSQASGAFVGGRKCRIVGGAAGWSQATSPKSYHNDAGVRAKTVADDAARAVGETITEFVPSEATLPRDYARRSTVPASRILEDSSGHGVWWVDYAGLTHVAQTRSTAKTTGVDIISYLGRDRVVIVAADDPAAVSIGSILSDPERISEDQTVREIAWDMADGKLRGICWTKESGNGSRLETAFRALSERFTDAKLTCKYRYRVVQMNDVRCELQAVSKSAGLPDILPVDEIPSLSGSWAELVPGTTVLVEFIEGNPGMPIMVGAAPRAWATPGESSMFPAKQAKIETAHQAALYLKENGNASLYTSEDGTEDGRPVFFTVAPSGFSWESPYGRGSYTSAGFHIRDHVGASFDLGSLSMPSPLDLASTYVSATAHTINLYGSVINLGPDVMPKDPIVLSTPLIVYLGTLLTAIEGALTAVGAGALANGPAGAAALASSMSAATASLPLTITSQTVGAS